MALHCAAAAEWVEQGLGGAPCPEKDALTVAASQAKPATTAAALLSRPRRESALNPLLPTLTLDYSSSSIPLYSSHLYIYQQIYLYSYFIISNSSVLIINLTSIPNLRIQAVCWFRSVSPNSGTNAPLGEI